MNIWTISKIGSACEFVAKLCQKVAKIIIKYFNFNVALEPGLSLSTNNFSVNETRFSSVLFCTCKNTTFQNGGSKNSQWEARTELSGPMRRPDLVDKKFALSVHDPDRARPSCLARQRSAILQKYICLQNVLLILCKDTVLIWELLIPSKILTQDSNKIQNHNLYFEQNSTTEVVIFEREGLHSMNVCLALSLS